MDDKGVIKLKKIESITFKHVSFSYPNSIQKALDDLSFDINDKEKVAIVGVNGSGKSTLIKLLLRFYDPTDGEILINGKSLLEYDLASLRQGFSVYFQEMENFPFSLEENYVLSDPIRRFNKIMAERALEISDYKNIISESDNFTRNLFKTFSMDGLILSGGQLQKIALSRALYRNKDVFILDEVSSNIDPESEDRIFNGLMKELKDNIVLFTSHRFSNLSLANRVIVLEKGKLVEDNTPEKLISQGGRFSELYAYQKKKYIFEENNDCCN